MVFAVKFVLTGNVVTFPTEALLYPVTNDEKLFTVDTSREYPVAPALAGGQFTTKETFETLLAVTVGAAGAVVNVPLDELTDVPLAFVALRRIK